jgi:hypothetical protein
MISAKNGQVMKWNSNMGPNFMHETRFRLFGQLYGESKVAQDIPFPGNKLDLIVRGGDPKGIDAQFVQQTTRSYQMTPSDNGQGQHMNREFFTAHKVAVVFMFFIENDPKNLASIDENGHIFIWKYTKEYVTSKQRFEPANKYRLELQYPRYVQRLKDNRVFPHPSQKEIDPSKPVTVAATVQQIASYMQSIQLPIVNA